MRTICCLVEWVPPARMRVFTGVTYSGSVAHAAGGDAALPQERAQAAAVLVPADHAHGHRRSAEGADVVHGVGAAAQAHVGAVVLEDEHGRLAAHPLHGAVDELVGHEVGQHEDAPAAEGADRPPAAAAR